MAPRKDLRKGKSCQLKVTYWLYKSKIRIFSRNNVKDKNCGKAHEDQEIR